MRTTIVLATALALTSFAVTAWAVGRQNYQRVAAAEVGAPAVLTVSPPQGGDLGAIVDRADPTGRRATVVDNYVSLSSGSGGDVTLGVDPQRFARIAAWQRDWAGEPLPELARKLDPPAPPPVVLSGNAMRVTVRVNALSLAGEQLSANVTTGASPVSLGSLPRRGTVTLTGPLVGCPCVLQSLQLGLSGAQISRGALSGTVSGNLVISSLEVRDHGRWSPARAGALADGSAWAGGHTDHPPDVIRATAAGLGWRFTGVSGVISPTLQSVNTPRVLPALIPDRLLAGRHGVFSGTGLDGSTLLLRPVADVAVVPSAPGNGVIVDRRYAELAAGLNLAQVTQQVWLAPGAQQQIVPKLKAEGVTIISVRSAAATAARFRRQGPALASVLFLADAAVAAVLAAGAAILGLYLSARRRRYEYAALEATGMRAAALRRAVLLEMAVLLGFGTIIGIATGLGSAALVLRSIPEFVSTPAVPLSYSPPVLPLTALLAGAVAVLVAGAVGSSVTLIRGIRLDQLREAPG